MKQILSLFFMIFTLMTYGQARMSVDTTSIRIGEQITYTIDADGTDKVEFPELKLKPSGGMELVKSLPIDTLKNRLYKKYLLTSFDSGAHVIPAQQIKINGVSQYLDSLYIDVHTVAVDTTKQGLHPVKTIYKAPPKTWRDYQSGFWWLLILALLGGLVWWFLKHRKTAVENDPEKQYSPYEWAKLQLNALDNSDKLSNGKIKHYYSDLTHIIRNYIERELHISAMEVTSGELNNLLNIYNEKKQLGLKKETLSHLHMFFQNADLVKFAKAKPIDINIREDRRFTEMVITEIHSLTSHTLNEEDETARLLKEEQALKQKRQKQRRLKIFGFILLAVSVIILWPIFTGHKITDGFSNYSTKKLFNKTWFTAHYGYPSVTVYAPFVLKPAPSDLPEHIKKQTLSQAHFTYGKPDGRFYMDLTTLEMPPQTPLDINNGINNAIKILKNTKGISDLDYTISDTNISGFSGQMVEGTYQLKGKKRQFQLYLMPLKNSLIELSTVYRTDDDYGKKLNNRLIQALKIERPDL